MTEFTHTFTAPEAAALREAFQVVAKRLTPGFAFEPAEDSGALTVSLELSAQQAHLQALAVYTAKALADLVGSRKDGEALGVKWAVDPGAPGGVLRGGAGGTLSGGELAEAVLNQVVCLAWQIVACRAGRPSIEDEARRRSAGAPELADGIIESERAKIECVTPVLRRLMD